MKDMLIIKVFWTRMEWVLPFAGNEPVIKPDDQPLTSWGVTGSKELNLSRSSDRFLFPALWLTFITIVSSFDKLKHFPMCMN